MDASSKKELFLGHLIQLIQENMRATTSASKAKTDFDAGKSLAYYEVADLIIECSNVFNVPLSDLGITNFEADRLL
ncbi:hypothetical protein [Spirosoma endophyticum]|uniref:Uncharacterized protein n=1 Tax=Spirosoma endophyticum TaxID=662367 RepID=A0A1I2HU22_9BACT|nr:hypothetical protein [Spirosoma endophyticum]SFF33252.1 hypothetical protein SAMN05216167_1492 [Spirosoma endophyticum]